MLVIKHRRQRLTEQHWQQMNNNMLYWIKIPSYYTERNVVYYQFVINDLITGKCYKNCLRFKVLKQLHQQLDSLIEDLPQFPKTHFWKKTNSDPILIEKRRRKLEKYLNIIFNHPQIRGIQQVKNVLSSLKANSGKIRACSQSKQTSSTSLSNRSYSLSSQRKPRTTLKQLQRIAKFIHSLTK